jgi:hypothetical protein
MPPGPPLSWPGSSRRACSGGYCERVAADTHETKTRDQWGYDLVYWSNALDVVLTHAAWITRERYGGQQRRHLDGAPLDEGERWMSFFDVMEWSQNGGFLPEGDLADWRQALGVRLAYLTEKRPDTLLVVDAAETFERLEGLVRERLGPDAPTRPVRYPARQPL